MKINWDNVLSWIKINLDSLIEYLVVILSAVATFLAPIAGFLILTTIAVTSDTVYTIYSKVKQDGRKAYRSNELFNLVPKTFFYMGTIVFAYMLDRYIIEDDELFGVPLLITKVVTVVWTYIEVKSIDERRVLNGKKSFFETVKDLLTKLQNLKRDLKGDE